MKLFGLCIFPLFLPKGKTVLELGILLNTSLKYFQVNLSATNCKHQFDCVCCVDTTHCNSCTSISNCAVQERCKVGFPPWLPLVGGSAQSNTSSYQKVTHLPGVTFSYIDMLMRWCHKKGSRFIFMIIYWDAPMQIAVSGVGTNSSIQWLSTLLILVKTC